MSELGPNGIALQEFELAPDAVARLRKEEQRSLRGRLMAPIALIIIPYFNLLYHTLIRRAEPISALNLFFVCFATIYVIGFAVLEWCLFRSIRAEATCRIQYTILSDGLRVDVLPKRKNRVFLRSIEGTIPWWKVSSKIDETNRPVLDSFAELTVPACCFANEEQRAVFRELAYRG